MKSLILENSELACVIKLFVKATAVFFCVVVSSLNGHQAHSHMWNFTFCTIENGVTHSSCSTTTTAISRIFPIKSSSTKSHQITDRFPLFPIFNQFLFCYTVDKNISKMYHFAKNERAKRVTYGRITNIWIFALKLPKLFFSWAFVSIFSQNSYILRNEIFFSGFQTSFENMCLLGWSRWKLIFILG